MSGPSDLQHAVACTQAAARRRRRRLLSAADNGAIVEYSSATFAPAPPCPRIPVPPRHLLTRPRLLAYYRLIAGSEPPLLRRDATVEGYNYNWFVPAGIEEKGRASKKGRRRLQEALIAARMPLSEVGEGTSGVFDSGRLCSPIRRHLRRLPEERTAFDDSGTATSQCDGGSEDVDNTVVLVRPVAWELPSEEQIAWEEAFRVAPKGREWDRQRAVRHSVGSTAQDALISCCIDPRYRRPGDFVRRNCRGELVDARGRPMRKATETH
ncbi:hypothetical protein DQ04_00791140 [Trypanosoma grayi]|uniref:hypothetical protein n=1 Tax=Trypanosoma grayi TaxID=71804 RepID=UPI0004F44C72|nr:hypothetical protein DQ04_00791140 [Trypanosoma grayi]KEG13784.1 hypothetical protein DQ04_00791140 [Trypanosoma grayi]